MDPTDSKLVNTASYPAQQAIEHSNTAGHLLFMIAHDIRAAVVSAAL